jgi:quinol-cytochrome oxidoreductase complex cytochrome b subunit
VRREALAALAATAVLVVLAAAVPPPIGPAAEFSALPADAQAPWIFIWLQELLRLGNPLLWGIAVPGTFLALLALVPYVIDRQAAGTARWLNRSGRAAQWLGLGLAALLLILTVRGALR